MNQFYMFLVDKVHFTLGVDVGDRGGAASAAETFDVVLCLCACRPCSRAARLFTSKTTRI